MAPNAVLTRWSRSKGRGKLERWCRDVEVVSGWCVHISLYRVDGLPNRIAEDVSPPINPQRERPAFVCAAKRGTQGPLLRS